MRVRFGQRDDRVTLEPVAAAGDQPAEGHHEPWPRLGLGVTGLVEPPGPFETLGIALFMDQSCGVECIEVEHEVILERAAQIARFAVNGSGDGWVVHAWASGVVALSTQIVSAGPAGKAATVEGSKGRESSGGRK